MNKKYIVAGNHEQFRNWVARRVKYDILSAKNDFVYVSHINMLKGLSDVEGYFVGSYKQRADIAEIQQQIHIIKATKNKNVSINNNTTLGTGYFSIISSTAISSATTTGSATMVVSPEVGDVKYDPIMKGLKYWNGDTWETAILNRT
jgi:hypothetical protein